MKRLTNNPLTVEIADVIEEYEKLADQESRFVYALDKIIAKFMIIHGQMHIWREHGITYEDWKNRNLSKMRVSPYLQPYVEELLKQLKRNLHLLAD